MKIVKHDVVFTDINGNVLEVFEVVLYQSVLL